jgi:hypothetical protein
MRSVPTVQPERVARDPAYSYTYTQLATRVALGVVVLVAAAAYVP